MNCHALFAFIDARKRWDEQQAKKAMKAAAAEEAAREREKKRCTAATKSGSRCRCTANGEDGLCATHRKHKSAA
jgi:hypothetical protein